MDHLRQPFEDIFSDPPYEWDMHRYAASGPWGETGPWPGAYVEYKVHCAWEGFKAGAALQHNRDAATCTVNLRRELVLMAEAPTYRRDANTLQAAAACISRLESMLYGNVCTGPTDQWPDQCCYGGGQ